jgi:hypothetical protein
MNVLTLSISDLANVMGGTDCDPAKLVEEHNAVVAQKSSDGSYQNVVGKMMECGLPADARKKLVRPDAATMKQMLGMD